MPIILGDEALLAELGYKQEFRRAFTPFEVAWLVDVRFDGPCADRLDQVFGMAFSIVGLLPSIA